MNYGNLADALANYFKGATGDLDAQAGGEGMPEIVDPVAALDDGGEDRDDDEDGDDKRDDTPLLEIEFADMPPPVVLSFAEQMDGFCAALTEEMSMQNAELVRLNPERWVWTACYDCAGDDRYTGRLGINPVTGKEEVFVSAIDGKTTFLP